MWFIYGAALGRRLIGLNKTSPTQQGEWGNGCRRKIHWWGRGERRNGESQQLPWCSPWTSWLFLSPVQHNYVFQMACLGVYSNSVQSVEWEYQRGAAGCDVKKPGDSHNGVTEALPVTYSICTACIIDIKHRWNFNCIFCCDAYKNRQGFTCTVGVQFT